MNCKNYKSEVITSTGECAHHESCVNFASVPPPLAKGDVVICEYQHGKGLYCLNEIRDGFMHTMTSMIDGKQYYEFGSRMKKLAINSQFTAPYGDDVCEFKVVARRTPKNGELYISSVVSPGTVYMVESHERVPFSRWIVERVKTAETFADGELFEYSGRLNVVLNHPYKAVHYNMEFMDVITGEVNRISENSPLISSLTIGSHFTTKCATSINQSGQGSFLVTEIDGDGVAPHIYINPVDGSAITCVDCPNHIIVIPCDLAYYTKTVNGITYVMYETDAANTFIVVNSEGCKWSYNYAEYFTNQFIRSLDLTPVPLSVSAITGIVAPKVGV